MSALAYVLNKRVTLQQKSAAQDEYGQPTEVWSDVVTVWAGIRDLTGRQYTAAQAAQNPVTSEITIRFREGVVPAMRAVHGADVYDIEAVLGTDRRTLTLMTVKGLSNG